jgi:general nucleoside transport system permease protein
MNAKSERTYKTKQMKLIKGILPSPISSVLVPVLSIILAFIASAIFLSLSGYDPGRVFFLMWRSSFGSSYALSETVVKMIPLLLCSLGVSIAFRMKLWNIGAEGQFHAGALGATWFALSFPNMPGLILLPLMFMAGFACGALWALLVAIPKALLDVNETITSLMLNYVAILLMSYYVYGPWRDPEGFNFPLTARFSDAAILPTLFGTRIHFGIVFGLIAALLVYLLFRYSKWGYTVRVIGESPSAARYAGMNIMRNILLVMIVSGGLSGIAGMAEVSGLAHRLQPGISAGYGYTAIIIAWLSRLHPWNIVITSFLFGALQVGSFAIQTAGLPAATVSLLHGLILFFILGGEIFTYYRWMPVPRATLDQLKPQSEVMRSE